MKYWYLASPYSHESKTIRQVRYLSCLEACALLFRTGRYVYSPIVHCHPLQVAYELPMGWEFWQEYDYCMIDPTEGLYILMLDGWRQSIGVQAEIAYAEALGKTLIYVTLEQLRQKLA